jgi:hypothetical protein
LKVFRHLTDRFEEFRLYHRDAGKVGKLRDDLISATRYALIAGAGFPGIILASGGLLGWWRR